MPDELSALLSAVVVQRHEHAGPVARRSRTAEATRVRLQREANDPAARKLRTEAVRKARAATKRMGFGS